MNFRKVLFSHSVFILCLLFLGRVSGYPYITEVSCSVTGTVNYSYNLRFFDSLILKSEKPIPQKCTLTVNTDKNRFVVMSYYKYSIETTDSLVFQDTGGINMSLTGFGDFPGYEKSIIFSGPVRINYVTKYTGLVFNRKLAFELLFTEAHDPTCFDYEFQCSNKKCIKSDNVCDKRNNCGDFSDEKDCNRFCHSTEFLCDNKMCIPGYKVCNGNNDCGDKSDEYRCEQECLTDVEFRCNNSRCVPAIKLCDGKNDCGDASDENECKRECMTDEFHCNNSRCVPANKVCDGKNGCGDKSDENGCYRVCYSYEFQCRNYLCINVSLKCNKKNDCGDWSDENSCTSTDKNEKVAESWNPWLISTITFIGLFIVAIILVIMLIRRSVVNKNSTRQTQLPAPSAPTNRQYWARPHLLQSIRESPSQTAPPAYSQTVSGAPSYQVLPTYPRTQPAYIRMDNHNQPFKVEE